MATTYRYTVPDECPESEYEIQSETPRYWLDSVAAEAAEDYHSRHGWESRWPLTFIIHDDCGKYLGKFSVSRDMVPHFGAAVLDWPSKR